MMRSTSLRRHYPQPTLKLPLRSNSGLSLRPIQETVLADMNSRSTGQLSAKGFIPFLQERDGLGRLISTPGRTERMETMDRKPGEMKRKLRELKLRLRKKVKVMGPALGTYTVNMLWGKKSFQTGRKSVTERVTMPPMTQTPILPKRESFDPG